MHSGHPFFSEKPMPPLGDQVGYYMQNAPRPSVFNGLISSGIKPPMPFCNVDIHPSDACPRNFIIFDQTNTKSQIMYHPEINSRMFHPGFGVETSLLQENVILKDSKDEGKPVSQLKEDSNDIDALLSTEYEDEESDDEVSTARTNAIYDYSSPDSCSNYESGSRKRRSVYRKSSLNRGNEKKQERMRKMVKALRGIVPGANQMSTVAVLDEAVRYLKSLRVEVKKLGVGKSTK
ncbi:hypothetical protein ACS0TY_017987 [Phlomoides rotata]